MPVYVLGSGTNVLVSDGRVHGLVIRLARKFGYLSVHDGNALVVPVTA